MRHHTSLHAWQEARATTLKVLTAARLYWKPYASALFAQLQGSSLSVQLNIAEGYTFADSPTFTRHLGIAYGSAVETGEILELSHDAQVLPESVAKEMLTHNRRCQRLLLGMLKRRRRTKP